MVSRLGGVIGEVRGVSEGIGENPWIGQAMTICSSFF